MEDPRSLHLDVYQTREGPWNPKYGELAIPEGWEFLPAGDVFLTRAVEAGGGRSRPPRLAAGASGVPRSFRFRNGPSSLPVPGYGTGTRIRRINCCLEEGRFHHAIL